MVYYAIVKKEKNKNETKEAREVLRKMLEKLNIIMPDIYLSKLGKPYFKDSSLYFNYSHSKNYIACAISDYEVGIDIEETDRIVSDAVALKYLDNVKSNNKRIEIWVKKEAYSKLKGMGLQIDISTIKLEEIKEKCLLIKNNDYICSIYSECKVTKFKKVNL